MTRFSVLLSTAALVVAIAAMSAGGSGIRDVVAPGLTDEVEALVEGSVLREYAGLGRTPIPPSPDGTPVPVAVDNAPLVEIPLVIGDGHTPLTDLDALYGVYGYGLSDALAPAPAAPPADLVDDTPAMIVATWNPPLDIK